MNLFFEWLASQNPKKIRTPFIMVFLLVFIFFHAELVLYLLPISSDMTSSYRIAAVKKLLVEPGAFWILDLLGCSLLSMGLIATYNFISVVQKWVTLFFENRLYPSQLEGLKADVLHREEADRLENESNALRAIIKDKNDEIQGYIEEAKRLADESKEFQEQLAKLKKETQTELNSNAQIQLNIFGNLIRTRISDYLTSFSLGRDEKYAKIIGISNLVKKSISSRDMRVTETLLRIQKGQTAFSSETIALAVKYDLISSADTLMENPITESVNATFRLSFFGMLWLDMDAYERRKVPESYLHASERGIIPRLMDLEVNQ